MKKVYLTRDVPEKGAGIEAYKFLPDDVQQKMLAHQNDRQQMQHVPPNIKMLPLAKWQVSK